MEKTDQDRFPRFPHMKAAITFLSNLKNEAEFCKALNIHPCDTIDLVLSQNEPSRGLGAWPVTITCYAHKEGEKGRIDLSDVYAMRDDYMMVQEKLKEAREVIEERRADNLNQSKVIDAKDLEIEELSKARYQLQKDNTLLIDTLSLFSNAKKLANTIDELKIENSNLKEVITELRADEEKLVNQRDKDAKTIRDFALKIFHLKNPCATSPSDYELMRYVSELTGGVWHDKDTNAINCKGEECQKSKAVYSAGYSSEYPKQIIDRVKEQEEELTELSKIPFKTLLSALIVKADELKSKQPNFKKGGETWI